MIAIKRKTYTLIVLIAFCFLSAISNSQAGNPEFVITNYDGLIVNREINVDIKEEQRVKEIWDQCTRIYVDNLGVKPADKVTIFIFGNLSSYAQKLAEKGCKSSWLYHTLGIALGKEIYLNLGLIRNESRQFLSELVAHELAHIWIFELKGYPYLQSRWLSEGYAYYSQKLIGVALGFETMESFRRKALAKIKGRYLPKLEEMDTNEGFSQVFQKMGQELGDDQVMVSYLVTAIDLLIAETSQKQINEYFGRTFQREPKVFTYADNFFVSFGMDITVFQNQLKEYIKKTKI